MKITFIGLGIMGVEMALNLLHSGVDLTVYNRSLKKAEKLKCLGARVAENVLEAVKDADVVITMLAHSKAIEEVMINNAMGFMKKGAFWVDCSTVHASFSKFCYQEAAQNQIGFLDAPVAGSQPQAKMKTLVFFLGNKQNENLIIEKLLMKMGKKCLHLGAVGQGASFKLLVNMMLAQAIAVFREVITLGKAMQIEEDMLWELLPSLPVAPPYLAVKSPAIRKEQFAAQFPLEWMLKDINLALQSGKELTIELHLMKLVQQLFLQAEQRGLAREDFTAIFKKEAGD